VSRIWSFHAANNITVYVGFEVITAVSTKMAVFWVVAPSTRLHGATTQKTAAFIKVYI
jgi:hypothetical protein